jgi:hypothetical protein
MVVSTQRPKTAMIHGRQEGSWGKRDRHIAASIAPLSFLAYTRLGGRLDAMEFDIVGIDSRADKYEVTKAIAAVLHSGEFFSSLDDPKARPMNFEVMLEESKIVGTSHNGRGKLRVPTNQDGQHFYKWLRLPENRIRFAHCMPFRLANTYAYITKGSKTGT